MKLSTNPSNTGREIAQLLAEGNEQAFQRFYETHWNKIYSLALAYLKSSAQAQDIVQDVFLKVWNQREKFKSIEKPESFVYMMGRNEVINALRRKMKMDTIDESTSDYLPDDFLLPHEVIDLKEMQGKVNAAIDTLPAQQKLIFKLSREEGLSHEQIAERLGIERATVKNHMVRALNTLRKHLGLGPQSLIFWFVLAEWFTNK